MSRATKLIHEVHRRSIWQVLLVYLGSSYAILEAVDLFTDRWGLPSWLFSAVAVLLATGLLVVLTAAILPDTEEEAEAAGEGLLSPAPAAARRWALRAVLAAMIVLAVGALAALLLLPRSSPDIDPDVVAVAPFDILDPELELWREGMVDVLSAGLDGAGPLRAVPPTAIIKRWGGRADRASAMELARETGAGLVIYGRLLGAGPDSVRLSATLLDVQAGRPLTEVGDLRGDVARIDRLCDSLAVRILGSLARTRSVAAYRLSSLGSSSPAAIKAFLQGEQHFRRSDWDSARHYYVEATEIDSTFALAFNRIAFASEWGFYGADVGENQLRAGRLNRGLAARESLLVVTDSLYAATAVAFVGDSTSWSRLHRLFSTLDRWVGDYPLDPAAWFNLGEARLHYGVYLGMTDRQAYEAFARSLDLDSAYIPGYLHLPELALALEGVEAGRHALAAYLAQGPTGYQADGYALSYALLDTSRVGSSDVQFMLDTLALDALDQAWFNLNRVVDPAESAVRIARAKHARSVSTEESSNERLVLASALAFRGHLGEAYDLLRASGLASLTSRSLLPQLAALGAVPPDTADAVSRSWLREGNGWGIWQSLRWWTLRGDTTALREALVYLDTLNVAESDTAGVGYGIRAATAYLALARGDTAGSIRGLAELPRYPWGYAYQDHLTLGELLSVAGRDLEAARIFDQRPACLMVNPLPAEILWILERARVNDRLGNREEAIRAYSYVAHAWAEADSILQPYVQEARAALTRLGREPRL